ncbi:ribosome small subunit-dependent GTPase A [Flagellimonas hymeniacidonis]|uniref:Small ribosomal subunit biogenesis GTPase RsgA n=1 Tax=Flagellimonas hymeniacidonis TaxID=2603628 RepID=A0A5C8V5Y9_9FLAO|nr:ribosome small subunit-dependent GTPase A [Flagellimonas hymeniacidonis]TXN37171.1 ribosome small subunit-dependent GTPase A [Flagellimonas hymeniacidonis]
MTLVELGYNSDLEQYRKDKKLDAFNVGRIISEHKDRYVVKTDAGEFDSELIGNLRYTAESRHDLPAVGDWVAISEYDEDKALIHSIYPRHSIIERKAVGKPGQVQIIATNIDYGLIVQSVNRDFNMNRLERYLAICNASKVKPIVVLSKIDLISEEELKKLLYQINERINGVPLIVISNESNVGLDKLEAVINKGETYCLLGSSGVGKSTLLNKISGKEIMDTGAISQSIDRGRHITSHRELVVLANGGILIDNPGMREVGITDSSSGIEITFDDIVKLSNHCKFKDCTHTTEIGCAVVEALEKGDIDHDSYENYLKMEREKVHFESTVAQRRKKDKDFGKMIKQFKNQKYKGNT